MKLLFAAPPYAGHLNWLIPLALSAREAGHDCTFLTSPAKAGMLRAKGFRVIVPASVPGDTAERLGNWPKPISGSFVEIVRQFNAYLAVLKPFSDEVEQILKSERPDIAIVDFLAAPVAQWCERLGIRYISSIASPVALENHRGVPGYLGGWSPYSGFIGDARDALGRWWIRTFKRIMFTVYRNRLYPPIDAMYRPDGTEASYSPYRIVGYGLMELEFDRDWPSKFEMIGPVFGEPEDAPPLVLPKASKYVLATAGTHVLWAKDGLVEDVLAIAQHFPDWHFVASLGQAADAFKPSSLAAPNVTVSSFVPYQRDLCRFDIVVHHGGMGVTCATIAAGVPALVVPRDFDQFDYAARVEVRGLGLRAKSLSGPQVPQLLSRLAVRENWPMLAEIQQALNRYRPHERFLQTLSEVAKMPVVMHCGIVELPAAPAV